MTFGSRIVALVTHNGTYRAYTSITGIKYSTYTSSISVKRADYSCSKEPREEVDRRRQAGDSMVEGGQGGGRSMAGNDMIGGGQGGGKQEAPW